MSEPWLEGRSRQMPGVLCNPLGGPQSKIHALLGCHNPDAIDDLVFCNPPDCIAIPDICNPVTIQTDCPSIEPWSENEHKVSGSVDCYAFGSGPLQCWSNLLQSRGLMKDCAVPRNPLTILQSLRNPFNFENLTSNQVIQGQLHETSQFWDTSKTAWSQSSRSRMDCIMHGAIQTAFRKSCGHFAIHQQSVNPVAIPWNLTISTQSEIALRLQITVPSQPSCRGWRGLQKNRKSIIHCSSIGRLCINFQFVAIWTQCRRIARQFSNPLQSITVLTVPDHYSSDAICHLPQSWGLQKGCAMPEHSQEPSDNPPIYVQSIQFRKFHMQSINPGAIPQNLTIPGQPRIAAKTARNPPPEQLHNWHTILGCLAQSIWIASGLQILKGLQVNWENCIKIVWVALEGLHHTGGRRSAFMQSCDRFAIHSASENPLTIS